MCTVYLYDMFSSTFDFHLGLASVTENLEKKFVTQNEIGIIIREEGT